MRQHFHPPVLQEMQSLRNEGVCRLCFQAAVIGGGSGAIIGCFRSLYDRTGALLAPLLHEAHGSLPPLWFAIILFSALIGIALLVSWITRLEPLISGSGIPQVELALAGRSEMPWRRIAPAKFFGTLLALTGGLSVGREGPCVQMGAAVGCGFGEILHEQKKIPRYLVGGAVAGLTAAFGAPLAGLFFAFEEMKTILSVPLLLFTSVAACTAWFVVDILFAFDLVYPFSDIVSLKLPNLWLAAVLGLGTGLLGVFYNWMQMKAALSWDRQKILPQMLKNLPAFLVAGGLFFVFPQVLNAVGLSMQDIAMLASSDSGWTETGRLLTILLAVKLFFSIFSFASGVPGGLLMPMLATGGMTGALCGFLALHGNLVAGNEVTALLPAGMAGLFAGTVRAPLTGIALVAEMSGAYNCLPGMVLASLVSTFVANRLGSVPIYDSLKKRLDNNLHRKKKRRHRKKSRKKT